MSNILDFYKGKKIFITGHTGFKGSWLCYILWKAGAIVKGYSLEPPTEPALFNILNLSDKVDSCIGDIRDYELLKREFDSFGPEIVIHLAAQPLVRESYSSPRYTYETNVMGTVNILECIRQSSCVKSFLNVTTDKVYENDDIVNHAFKEDEKLDGFDPYSNSKSCSEIITHSYKKSFLKDVAVSTARAGNVIGGGDFSKDRIIPDCIRAIMKKENIVVRNPYSTRPYQHILEPLFAYLLIVKKEYEDDKYQGWYNVGPNDEDSIETGKLVDLLTECYGEGIKWIKKYDGGPHEAHYLKLDTDKIRSAFDWKPTWNIKKAIWKTVEWYKCYLKSGNIFILMDKQIEEFLDEME